MANLSIIIVNYNAGDYLTRCLESIDKVKDEAIVTTYVVDNASMDTSIKDAQKKFPKVTYILNNENLGFGRANNIALRKITTEYILLLNPDTILEKGVIQTLLQYMDNDKKIGAATCKIIFDNGNVDLTAHRGFPTPWAAFLYFIGNSSLYHLTNTPLDKAHEVDAISGAFFFSRKKVLEEVDYFDEDYFMYAEDIDLCYKIKEAGYKVLYIPDVQIIHYKGVSSGLKKHTKGITTATLETRQRSLNAFYETMKIFYKKHYEKEYPFLVNWMIYLAIDVKWWMAKRKLTV